ANGDDMAAKMTALAGTPGVRYVEPNYILTASAFPNDPRFDELWGLHNTGQTGGIDDADIDGPEIWDQNTGSRDVIVGIIDTGVDYNHEDLAANMWTNPGETPGNGIDDDGNGLVDDVYGWDWVDNDNDPVSEDVGVHHGTHVAGTVGAVGDNGVGVTGVSWNVQLMALRFLGANGSGLLSDAISAINYATAQGATLTCNSWGGGGFSQAMVDAIAAAGDAGQLFVAAAGNDGSDNDANPAYPASYDLDNIISVAATNSSDALAGFSNWGLTTVDLAAPGVAILSTQAGNTYGTLSGTSMATPHVAGAAALIHAGNPNATWEDVKATLLDSTDAVSALDGRMVTGGRLNVGNALVAPARGLVAYLRADDGTSQNSGADGVWGSGDIVNGEAGSQQGQAEDFTVARDWLNGWENAATLHGSVAFADVTGVLLQDNDGDGMPDLWERQHGLDWTSAADALTDADSDGLNNWYEFLSGTDPNRADTDYDGLSDADESADTDALTNLEEQTLGTHPDAIDTDDDGYNDDVEVAAGTSATDASTPQHARALALPTATGYLAIAPATVTALSSFTVEAMVRPDAVNGIIFARRLGAGRANVALSLNGWSPVVSVTQLDGSAVVLPVPGRRALAPHAWSHLGATYDEATGTLNLYINGDLVATTTAAALLTEAPGAVTVIAGEGFTGQMDDLRVWTSVRDAEMAQAGAATVDEADPALLANFSFNDGGISAQNGLLSDSTPWFNGWQTAGTLVGAANFANEAGSELTDSDTDGDGMPNWWEVANGLDPADAADATADPDADDLNNLYEFWAGTNPNNNASINPAILDGRLNSDGDALLNKEEQLHGTRPDLADTDDDGIDDSTEINAGTNPRYASSQLADALDAGRAQVERSLDLSVSGPVILPNGAAHNAGGGDWTIEFYAQLGADKTGELVAYDFGGGFQYRIDLNAGALQVTVTDVMYNDHTLAGAVINDSDWHAIAVVWDSANRVLTAYVDGLVFSEDDFGDEPLVIGSGNGALVFGRDLADGRLDAIRSWSVARNQAEIAANRAYLLPVGEAGLVAAYHFDDAGESAQSATATTDESMAIALPAGSMTAPGVAIYGQGVTSGHDSDSDGLPDWFEDLYGEMDGNSDADGDLLTARWEYFANTNPTESDTDGNGTNDANEDALPVQAYPGQGTNMTNLDKQTAGLYPWLLNNDDDNSIANLTTTPADDAAELDTQFPADPTAPTNPADASSQEYPAGALQLAAADYLSIPDSLELANGTFAISAWINPTTLAESTILHRSIGGGRATFVLGLTATGHPYVGYTGETTGSVQQFYSLTPVAVNTWTQIGAAFDGTTLTLYRNGRVEATNDLAVPADLAATSGPGPITLRAGEGFTGQIIELSIGSGVTDSDAYAAYLDGTAGGSAIRRFALKDGGTTAASDLHPNDNAEGWRHAGIPVVPPASEWRVLHAEADLPRYDQDGDGLTGAEEDFYGTRRDSADSDDDGITDGDEVAQGSHPAYSDSGWDPVDDDKRIRSRHLDLGLSGRVTLPMPARFDRQGGSWTIEMWVDPQAPGQTGALFQHTVHHVRQMELGLDGGTPYVLFEDNLAEPRVFRVDGAFALPVDRWTHIAASWNAATPNLTLVVDGVSVSDYVTESDVNDISLSGVRPVSDPTANEFEHAAYLGSVGMTARVDEVRVWLTALTPAQIDANKSHAALTNEQGLGGLTELLAHYRFDDGGGTVEDHAWPQRGAAATPFASRELGSTVVDVSASVVIDGVTLPNGNISFADAVVAYENGSPGTNTQTDTSQALGSPELLDSGRARGAVSLGIGGSLTVQFVDNVLVPDGTSGVDIWVFEVGRLVEPVMVEISADGETWVAVGSTSGATSGVDIDPFVASDAQFSYLRLTDPGESRGGANVPGADIDAIAAVSTAPVIVPPTVSYSPLDYVFATAGVTHVGSAAPLHGQGMNLTNHELGNGILGGEHVLDSDGNGLPDWFEAFYPDSTISTSDEDNDGITALYEYQSGLNPTLTDTDGNGTADGDEDPDSDGLTVLEEQTAGTLGYAADTDEDGLDDGNDPNPTNSLDPHVNRALALTDGQQVIIEPSSAFEPSNGWSIEMWVRLDAGETDATLFARSSGGAPHYAMGIRSSRLYAEYVTEEGVLQTTWAFRQLITETWFHVAAVYDPALNAMILYVNGTEEWRETMSVPPSRDASLQITQVIGGDLNGRVDDVRIWTQAVSVDPFAGTSVDYPVVPTTGLAAYYRFDDEGLLIQNFAASAASEWATGWPSSPIREGGLIDEPGAPIADAITFDTDNDQLPDWWELAFLGDLSQDGSGDQDGDSVTNLYEYLAALDPTRVRTENLGLDDGDRDIDSDGLTVLEEQTAGTSPASIDTDDDGLSDAEEIFGVNDIYGVITTADPGGAATNPADSLSPAISRSLWFDGSDDYLAIPRQPRHLLSTWTIEMWIKPGVELDGAILARNLIGNGISNFEFGLEPLSSSLAPYAQYQVQQPNGTLKEYKVGGTQLDIPALGIFHTWHALTDGLVTANQWSHLSAVIDPANESMTLYVNGLLVAERTNVTAGPDLSQGLAGQVTIGGIPSGAGAQMFAGQIDDVRIWNVARPID
ncbi:MAG TPA: hypothetical protein DCR55_11670, partial [Lentisphaeria bacterium]|nr:hypothetical protein [Lentisphaeria bacterium]